MKFHRNAGFSLIELMLAVVVVGILAAVAIPSYNNYIVRGSRIAAQTELLTLATLEEKIYLNANAYSANVTTAYDGTSTGGLGVTSGMSSDGKYTFSLNIIAPSQTYTLTATPVAGKSQANDGIMSISENGAKICASNECKNGVW